MPDKFVSHVIMHSYLKGLTRLIDCCLLRDFRALEEKAYNHITASYYLIAERHLRQKREAQLSALQVVAKQPDTSDVHDR